MTQKKTATKKLTAPIEVKQAAPISISNCTFQIEPPVFDEYAQMAIVALAGAAKANATAISDIAAMFPRASGAVGIKIMGAA